MDNKNTKKTSVHIFQILGNLKAYKQVKYKFPIDEDFEATETYFASLSLMKYFKQKGFNVKLSFFAPESLVEMLPDDSNNWIELLKNPDNLRQRLLEELLSNQIINSNDLENIDLKIIPSKGNFFDKKYLAKCDHFKKDFKLNFTKYYYVIHRKSCRI
ncbi:MAG: hypothetical protein ACTSRZ_17625, partial [Promethearchaeota archaeon]